MMNEIRHYIDSNGHDLVNEWLRTIRDAQAKYAIDHRIQRLTRGNFGDHKSIRPGVWELQIDVGQGYRVYYAKESSAVILLLCGGDKRKQQADIERACECRRDWKARGKRSSP